MQEIRVRGDEDESIQAHKDYNRAWADSTEMPEVHMIGLIVDLVEVSRPRRTMDPTAFYHLGLRIIASGPAPIRHLAERRSAAAYYAALNRADEVLTRWGRLAAEARRSMA